MHVADIEVDVVAGLHCSCQDLREVHEPDRGAQVYDVSIAAGLVTREIGDNPTGRAAELETVGAGPAVYDVSGVAAADQEIVACDLRPLAPEQPAVEVAKEGGLLRHAHVS